MNPASLLSPEAWAIQTFSAVQLGDQRRTDRVVRMAAAMAAEPNASLPKQMRQRNELYAAYRLLGNEEVTHTALLEPHWQDSRQATHGRARVLLVQDTTDLNYSQHAETSGLGSIGRSKKGHGFLLQTVLALDPMTHEVLGMVYQEPFVRKDAPKGETRTQRRDRERESQAWERAVHEIGRPPGPGQWVHVGDRYSDIFTFWQQCEQEQCAFLVRAAQDRRVQAEHPEQEDAQGAEMTHLFSLARSLPAQGLQVKQLKAQHERPAREAKLQVSFQAITIWPPKNGAALSKTPIQAWVVRVWEEEPPDGCEPLEWILVTTLPVETEADAWQCVEWYGYRWLCEDYHQGLKTGCALEARQVRSYEALTRLLGLLAPMAVRLLQLRAAAQHAPDAPATSVIPDEIVQVVTALTPLPEKPHPKNKSAKRPADQPMTLDELWRAIAGLGGYLGRKGDGPPGWKTLWRGWFYVQQVLDGVHLAARLPSFKNV